MAVKTTRIKTAQAPRMVTFDLTSQLDGHNQTFTLPEPIKSQDTHYLLWNGQVYRNNAGRTFYTILDGGNKIRTAFDNAPKPGTNFVLQFVKTDNSEGSSNNVTVEEFNALEERVAALEERLAND